MRDVYKSRDRTDGVKRSSCHYDVIDFVFVAKRRSHYDVIDFVFVTKRRSHYDVIDFVFVAKSHIIIIIIIGEANVHCM